MNLLWPGFLLLLGLIPIIIAVYIWMLRRRRRYAVRYSSLSLVRAALPQQSRWRRHLPLALFLLGFASLVVALGRPMASVVVPSGNATIMLAMDISGSMCSTDIQPNRLLAAEDAALSFIHAQHSNTQIGIVAFAGFAEIIQAPTRDQTALEKAIRGLTTARRTAIGSGILKSLDAIAEVDESIPPTDPTLTGGNVTPVPPGTYAPHIIVLLTDGASNTKAWKSV
jgi:Ca-activated chloride channel family protein